MPSFAFAKAKGKGKSKKNKKTSGPEKKSLDFCLASRLRKRQEGKLNI
jgi:hypothetical protein